MGCRIISLCYAKTTTSATPIASHIIWKGFDEPRATMTGADINFCLNPSKASRHASSNINLESFSIAFTKGGNLLEVIYEAPVKTCMT